ncbi:oligo-1,4-1,6-alpha-glucosidase [Candidatus Moduliflexus flocculans]|uniref:Oligo-1,4-1,6-alpha-glucosidase n=1 Tax=Candidatus Moduliflexus flocculans TaxID=1499966 RepID=A0A0S6VS71_9BACT|nr:oligo-1,4-1,6-alpha-glucosidase [Candidatus Moduliflexus flocculans]
MKQAWWKESVVYQIYPRSFYDSNGDGIGDLRGIIQKLDYLKELGVNVVWLSPVYKSPNDDNGYDISDYQDIMDEFGTLADWRELIAGMHERGIKLVMDLVVNHTSDEHRWFQESRQSKDNPYRDYYIWRPGKDGREPNNWKSFFGGSAWQYDELTGEYYLHLFSKKQPDLNWENPNVRKDVFKMMHWWLKQGVDGFRMDVINLISKVPGLPDVPPVNDDRYQFGSQYFANGPRLLEFLDEMKRSVLSHYDILTVGETPFVTTKHAIDMTNEETGALKMVFQFEHMDIDRDRGSIKAWKLTELKRIMSRWQNDLEGKGWNSIYLTNHDQPRPVSRFGNDTQYRVESAKMLATFTHLQQGTPYVYQGEEIGMTNVAFESINDYRDIESLNMYKELVEEKGWNPDDVLALIRAKGRDNARTPMQWDDSPNAGFTTGTPWMKVNPNYPAINVKQALADPNSVFYYYQKLLRLRKEYPIFVYGSYDLILDDDEAIYAFTRTLDNDRLLVILNFTAQTPVFTLPSNIVFADKELLLNNYAVESSEDIRQFTLRPYEARVYRLR